MTEFSLDSSRKVLIRLSAALATGNLRRLEEVFREAAHEVDPAAVEEGILQSYLFLGYPAALNALALWRSVSGEVAGEEAHDGWRAWSARGEEVCRIVYGGQYERLRRNVRDLHPDLERWMVVEGYGKVLGRPGLDLATRELCIAALLAVLNTPRQLYSHLRGALNAGASPEEVEETLKLVFQEVPELERWDVQQIWDRVKTRRGSSRELRDGGRSR